MPYLLDARQFCEIQTTGKAALALGRDYVGVELNPDYAERSRRRLEGRLL